MNHEHLPRPMEDRVVSQYEQVTELLLLLPGQHAADLEMVAHCRGLTMGQLIRLLIRDYLADQGRTLPTEAEVEPNPR